MKGGPVHRRWTLRVSGGRAEDVFATIADVESYPQFLSGVVSARVVRREPGRWMVENAFGLGPWRSRFRSHAEVDPPSALTIRSSDGPWRRLEIAWRVRQEGRSCLVSCAATLDFRSPVLAALARFSAADMERRVIAAFAARMKAAVRDAGGD